MKKINPAIVLYLIAGVFFLLSAIINSDELALISKPIVSSSMIFYYFQEKKGKINFLHFLVLFLLFSSGIFNLFEDDKVLIYVLILNLTAYTILLGIIIKKVFELDFKITDDINLSYIFLMLLFFLCIYYVSVFLIFDESFNLYYILLGYGFILFLVGVLMTVLFTYNSTLQNVNLMLAVFCFIICDSFYVIYYYYYNFLFFRYVSILANIASFYFLVHSFVLETKSVVNLKK